MIRLVLASHVRLFRDGLAHFLGNEHDLSLAASFSQAVAALAHARSTRPEVILIDAAMPGARSLVAAVSALDPRPAVVILSIAAEEQEFLDWAEAGIDGFVPCEGSLRELVDTVRAAVRGELRCSSRLAGSLLRRMAESAAMRGAAGLDVESAPLTPREQNIVALLDQNLSNKEIAQRLHIEVATVKTHVHHVLEKLQLRRRTEAAAFARRRGWLRAEGF